MERWLDVGGNGCRFQVQRLCAQIASGAVNTSLATIRLLKKIYGRPGVAIPDGVVPAGNGFPNVPLTGVRAPVPAVMV